MKSPRILISGAGVAGLALARRFEQLDIEYTLLEKHSVSSHSGSGIALPFNAIQALRTLGLSEQVLASSHQVHEIIYAKKNGNVLSRASLDEAPLSTDKFVAMHRSKLHEILVAGVKSPITLRHHN